MAPVIRLIKTKEIPAANAPPARSLAQLPPIANANSKFILSFNKANKAPSNLPLFQLLFIRLHFLSIDY